MQILVVAILTLTTGAVPARTFTVANACSFTIWPAIFTDLNVANNVPDFPRCWEAQPGTNVIFQVPDNWKAGRIWGRTDCNFAGNLYGGPNTCLSGGCNGGYQCDSLTGIDVPPVTLAQWNLEDDGDEDWYYDEDHLAHCLTSHDFQVLTRTFYVVSVIDGYNLPMSITNNVGCPVANCSVDLVPNCPAPLEGPYDTNGLPIGCKSACLANLNSNQANPPNCCTGQYSTPETCPASGVDFYDHFKSNCASALVYGYDDTGAWKYPSYNRADYTLTFCP